MSLEINQEQSIERIPEGTYPARISIIADLGTQMEVPYQKTEAVEQKRIAICFEFPTETIEIDGEQQPRWLTKEYTKSFGEKANLMKLVKALKPDAKTLNELSGIACAVSVGSTATGNAKVTTVSDVMKGIEVAPLSKPGVVFDFENPDLDHFNSIPEFLQNKVKAAVNYNGFAGDTPLVGNEGQPDDDNPFDKGE